MRSPRPLAAGLALLLVGVGAGGCAPVLARVTPGALAKGEILTIYGADFSRAEFADPHLTHDELVARLVPEWSRHLTGVVAARLRKVGQRLDLAIAKSRNEAIPNDVLSAGASLGDPPGEDALRQAVAPYVDHEAGKGLVLIVQRITRHRGAQVFGLVFDRASGEVLIAGGFHLDGDGYGVRAYYLSALREIAWQLGEAVNGQVGR